MVDINASTNNLILSDEEESKSTVQAKFFLVKVAKVSEQYFLWSVGKTRGYESETKHGVPASVFKHAITNQDYTKTDHVKIPRFNPCHLQRSDSLCFIQLFGNFLSIWQQGPVLFVYWRFFRSNALLTNARSKLLFFLCPKI